MQGYHTGLPHLLFPSKQHIKHDKRVKQCLKLKTPAGRRGTLHAQKSPPEAGALHAQKRPPARRDNTMRKNAHQLGERTPCAKMPAS